MPAIVSSLKYSRSLEIWKIGLRNVLKSVQDPDSGGNADAEEGFTVFSDVKTAFSGNHQPVFVFGTASPWIGANAPGRIFHATGAHPSQDKLPTDERGVPLPMIRVPTMGLAAISKPANFPARFRQGEHKAKHSRAAVILSPAGAFSEKGHDYRNSTYLHFFRAEVAAFLDSIASRYNIHVATMGTGDTQGDADFDTQDLILRMNAAHAPIAHSGLNGHEILAIISNASLVLTDSREVAAAARRCGAIVFLFSNRFQEEVPEASIYGAGFFEPYSVSAPAIERRWERLQHTAAALELVIPPLMDRLKAACTVSPAIIVA